MVDELAHEPAACPRRQGGHCPFDLLPRGSVTENGRRARGSHERPQCGGSAREIRVLVSPCLKPGESRLQADAGGKAEHSPLVRICAGTEMRESILVLSDFVPCTLEGDPRLVGRATMRTRSGHSVPRRRDPIEDRLCLSLLGLRALPSESSCTCLLYTSPSPRDS